MLRTFGILREAKFPPDSRVVLTPVQLRALMQKDKDIAFFVQPSQGRCFRDSEFSECGIPLQENLQHCEVLFGVKEVPYDLLIPGKTYFFFSHTIKKQPHNRKLLRALLEKKITMIDYECLKDAKGKRVIAFGRWAGIIGTHNAFWTWGERTQAYHLPRARDCHDYEVLKEQYLHVHPGPVRIVLTGRGRVAGGCREILELLRIREVSPGDFLEKTYNEPVFVNLDTAELYREKESGRFDHDAFFAHPDIYKSIFLPYTRCCDLLINAIYWDPRAPRLFSKADMRHPSFTIRVIADISCDVNGGIPATIRATTINDPVFGYDVRTGLEIAPFIPESIDIMAIDNLPNELPRNASDTFGKLLTEQIWPALFLPHSDMLEGATICRDGMLTPPYYYLKDFAGVEG